MTIKLFPLTAMQWSSFSNERDLRFLANHGVVMTDRLDEANILLTNRFPLSQYGRLFSHTTALRHWFRSRLSKPLLVWTHEPRWCTLFEPYVPPHGIYPPIHVMNVYTGDVGVGNLATYGDTIRGTIEPVTDPAWRRNVGRPIAALATYIYLPDRFRLMRDGRNIDLAACRQRLIHEGWRRGCTDVYGYRWPKRIRVDQSRWNDQWHDIKLATLERYRFNICLENTVVPGYCTEKLWDAIRARCLPIYWGEGTRIYDDFPQESFIDVSRFRPMGDVFGFIESLSDAEYLRRLNCCIGVYNCISKGNAVAQQHERMLLNIVDKVKGIVHG